MEVNVKYKIFGKRGYFNKIIKLPDFCASYLERYTIEIVEYRDRNCMGIYFQTKEDPNTDIWSHLIVQPGIPGNIVQGFKQAFEDLEHEITRIKETTNDVYTETFSMCGLS
jgi:hypothetical protein